MGGSHPISLGSFPLSCCAEHPSLRYPEVGDDEGFLIVAQGEAHAVRRGGGVTHNANPCPSQRPTVPITTPNSAHHNAVRRGGGVTHIYRAKADEGDIWALYMPSCSAYDSSITRTLPLQISSSAAVFSLLLLLPPTADAISSGMFRPRIRSGTRGEAHRARGPLVRRRFRARARFSHHAISKFDHKELE
jgi:hypothetical protein